MCHGDFYFTIQYSNATIISNPFMFKYYGLSSRLPSALLTYVQCGYARTTRTWTPQKHCAPLLALLELMRISNHPQFLYPFHIDSASKGFTRRLDPKKCFVWDKMALLITQVYLELTIQIAILSFDFFHFMIEYKNFTDSD